MDNDEKMLKILEDEFYEMIQNNVTDQVDLDDMF